MKPPFILSADNADAAKSEFEKLLDQQSNTITLLLVLGDDPIALKGREFVHFLLEDSPDDYKSVAFIFVPAPSFLLGQLQKLKVKTGTEDFDWNNFDDYAVLSISPDTNVISAVVTRQALDAEPAEIQIAILAAFENGGMNNP